MGDSTFSEEKAVPLCAHIPVTGSAADEEGVLSDWVQLVQSLLFVTLPLYWLSKLFLGYEAGRAFPPDRANSG